MAQKRMFDKRVVDSDKFADLPNSSKALYFMAGMQADDRGFFQPRKLQREFGFSDDDFKILIAKSYFILFESGVMVVTDWNKNNWLDNRRITETEYVEELKLLKLVNSKYELENNCLADAKPMLSQNSIEENSIEENSIEYSGQEADKCPPKIEIEKELKKDIKHKYGEYQHVLLSDKELDKLKNDYSNYKDLIKELDEQIELHGYKYKSHYLAIKKWVVDAVKRKETQGYSKISDLD